MNRTSTLTDDDTDESSVQRTVAAKGAGRPVTNAPNSVFDAGRKAKDAAAIPKLAPHQIVIRKGVEKPKARGESGSIYLETIRQMKPTDSVELPISQAKSFYARAKEFGKSSAPPPALQLPHGRPEHRRRVA